MAIYYTMDAQEQHPYTFDPVSTALLIIDMQNEFCHPQGNALGWVAVSASMKMLGSDLEGTARTGL